MNSLRYRTGLRAGSGLPALALHLGDLGFAHTDDSIGQASRRLSSSSAQAADPLAPQRGLLLPRDAPARGPSALLADAPFRLPGSACARPPQRSHPRGCRGRQSPQHLPFVIQPVGTAPSLDLDTSGAYPGLTLLEDGRTIGRGGSLPARRTAGLGARDASPGCRHGRGGGAPELPRLSSGGLLTPQGRWRGPRGQAPWPRGPLWARGRQGGGIAAERGPSWAGCRAGEGVPVPTRRVRDGLRAPRDEV